MSLEIKVHHYLRLRFFFNPKELDDQSQIRVEGSVSAYRADTRTMVYLQSAWFNKNLLWVLHMKGQNDFDLERLLLVLRKADRRQESISFPHLVLPSGYKICKGITFVISQN